MDVEPIRNDRDHARAVRQIEKLWGAKKGSPGAKKLEVLVTLVDAYEAKHHRIDPPDPIEVSEILNRRRPLTVAMIRRLRDALGISADVLIGRESSAA